MLDIDWKAKLFLLTCANNTVLGGANKISDFKSLIPFYYAIKKNVHIGSLFVSI